MTLNDFLDEQEQLAAKATKVPWHCAKHSNDARNIDKELICTRVKTISLSSPLPVHRSRSW